MPLDPQLRRSWRRSPRSTSSRSPWPLRTRRASPCAPAPPALGPVEDVPAVADHHVPVTGGEIPVRVYSPGPRAVSGPGLLSRRRLGDRRARHPRRPLPVARQRAGCAVASVDYRLAPEFPSRPPPEDSWAGLRWIAENGAPARRRSDPHRGRGRQCGRLFAAVMALLARDRRGPGLTLQLLIYPVTIRDFDTPSYRENANRGPPYHRGPWAGSGADYLAPRDRAASRRLAAAGRSLGGPAARAGLHRGFDPLCDEGEAYAPACARRACRQGSSGTTA